MPYIKIKIGFNKILPALTIVLFSFPSLFGHLQAESFKTVELQISWSAVAQASGYAVAIQSMDGTFTDQKKVKENRITLQLPPGEFQLRLASLNKFGKPSAWSTWKSLTVTGESRVQTVENLEKEEKAPEPIDFSWTSWTIPGLPDSINDDGDPINSILWISPFVIGGAYIFSEKQGGDNLARDPLNDPVTLTLAFYNQPLPLLFYLQEQREQQSVSYDKHTMHQQLMGGVLIAIWASHFYYSYNKFGNKSETEPVQSSQLLWSLFPVYDPHSKNSGAGFGLTLVF